MNTLTEKERQAIIKVLQKCEILDEIDIVCSEIQESLAELRKNPLTESLVEWAQRNGYSMRSDGNWERGSAIESDESLMRMYNAELRKDEAPSGWMDVNVKSPESGRCVLLYSKEGRVAEGTYNNVKGVYEQWRWNTIVNPTHWMYLPSPPSNNEEDPSEDSIMDLMRIFEAYFTESDSGHSWSIGATSVNAFLQETAKLLTPSQSYQDGLVEGKRQAVELAKNTCIKFIEFTAEMKMDDKGLAEFYKEFERFQNAEPK